MNDLVETIKENRPQRISKTQKPTNIPQDVLQKFVGEVPNLYKIDAINVYNNKYRVNVWTKHLREGQITPVFSLTKSYFVLWTEEGIVDLTIRNK